MNRRTFVISTSIPVLACLSGCIGDSIADTAFTPRYSADELPTTDPIFKSEKGLDIEQGEATAFIANSKDQLREQMVSKSTAIETWESYQDVAFMTAISVVLPIRSHISYESTAISGRTLQIDIKTRLDPDYEDHKLGYHRMTLYWTQDYPIAKEPTEIQLVE